MYTVAIISRKGGAGKTTLAINLAVAGELAGAETIVPGHGPAGLSAGLVAYQGLSVSDGAGGAGGRPGRPSRAGPGCRSGSGGDRHGSACGPAGARGGAGADLVIVPCRPSIFDLEAARASFAIAEQAGTVAVGLVWSVPARSSLGGQAVEALRGAGIRLIGDVVGQRAAYSHAATAGQGVQEFAPRSRAACEIKQLYLLLTRAIPMAQKHKMTKRS